MKNTSTEFNTIAENPFGAKYIHKIIDLTNNTEIKDDIDDFLYSAMINDDDVFTIGNTCSATISFSIINPTVNLNNKEIKVYQGLDINGTVEYVKLGVFKVLKPKKDRNITKYQCVDRMTYLMNMPYSSNLTFPTTDVKILEEICSQVGISLVQNGLISHSISKKPSGYTKREIIAYISQLQGKNARINSDGNLELIWYTDTDYVVDDNKIYYDGTSDVNSEIDYEVEYLECTVRSLDGTDETVIKAGTGTNGIKIENPFMAQTILYELANKLVGFTFRGAEFEFLGDFRLEVGDVVSVETNGEVYRVPIMQIEHKSDGGVVTTITSIGETDTENEIDLSSPNVNAMDRYYAELVLINKAMINKLSVDEADIKYLKVTQLEGIEANIENAVIENLEGKFITVEELDAEKARITVLEANSLTSDSAIIKDLQAGVTKTNTLIFGSASGDTIQTSFSNSVIAQLGDAQIESAMIKEISALKITGLDLNTTKFTVHSEDGLSYWEDNTIVMHDGVLATPRIQIGKDGSGDYNMYIWNAQGKLMFDALGVTENGITRQIIRDDIVKEDANINASKLNIESLFSTINNDNTYTLKSSKILIDEENQTLDVSFKMMKSNIDGLQTTQTSQGTEISTIQGQISSKIWQQDITTAIDDIEIGGRNYIHYGKGNVKKGLFANFDTVTDEYGELTLTSKNNYVYKNLKDGFIIHTRDWEVGATIVFSYDIMYTKWDFPEGTSIREWWFGQRYANQQTDSTDGTGSWEPVTKHDLLIVGQNGCELNKWYHVEVVKVIPSQAAAGIRTEELIQFSNPSDTAATITLRMKNVKIEYGTKATDWTPAPEDTEANITALNTQYSSIDQTVNSISGTVASHTTQIQEKADAKTVTKISDNLTLMQADLDGFKTTVSSTYTTKTDFNNLEIGGRNLVINSSKYRKDSPYTRTSSAKDGVFVTDMYMPCKNGETYTFQCCTDGIWVRHVTDGTATGWVHIYLLLQTEGQSGAAYSRVFSLDKDQILGLTGKQTWTYTVPDNDGKEYTQITFRFDIHSDGVTEHTVNWWDLKAERGTKATDWTPAPEDIDTELESTKSIATQTSEMMDWLVESGTSATNFTLTDRMAELTAQIINLNGNVKVSGDMLVDGAITADKLATDAIMSRNYVTNTTGSYLNLEDGSFKSKYLSWDKNGKFNAKSGEIGKWSILTGGGLMAETITSTPGTLNRMYLQPFNNTDYDNTWVISSQYWGIDSDGNETSEGEAYWCITGGGDFYTAGYVQTSMLYADMATIYGKTEIYGNGLELYYSTPYIDFHYNNNTTDHTARIIENSSGALTVYNTISNASDRRLKQDICSLDKRYLNALNLFKPTSYRFIKGSDNLNLGFLAQDIEKALLDCGITDLPIVSQDNDGMYALDYNQITALNTLGHLDHEKRIQELENNLAIANALIQSLLIQQSTV